ncbi:GerAB/ArcD/ProY family transporter [Paenibacillus glacialis]|uniref:Uncharacterized protein n=1 Tax=Paenibacillus glacialis TaxID=494026 RepID=A0A162Q3Y7_9BACL|nr:endospore germination permease [Paenibacillus glacialis]OAB42850.1 hypothetical protein PGLA_10335 [Paenibacillus glacialis]
MNKITPRQIILLGIVYMLPFVINGIRSISIAKQHTYVTYLMAAILFMGVLWMLLRSAKRFPDQDLFQSLVSRFPVIGRGVGFLYILFFLYILTRDIRIMVDYTRVVLLPNTPFIVTSLLIIATVVFIVRGGLRTLISLSEIMGPIVILALFIMLIMLFKDFHLENMMPFFHMDIPGVSEGTWLVMSSSGQIIMLPLIISSKDYRYRDPLYSLVIGTLLIVLVVLTLILVIGVPLAERLMYPSYELVREIRIADFLDRFDLLFVLLWYPFILINMAISLYVICYGLKIMVPSVSGKMMAAPIGLLSLSCSAWFFRDTIQMLDFNHQWAWIALVFEIIIPIGMFVLLRPRKTPLKN